MCEDHFPKNLVNICAWCGKKKSGDYGESLNITHGICLDCCEDLISEFKESMSDEI